MGRAARRKRYVPYFGRYEGPSILLTCAGCKGPRETLLRILEPVGGQVWPAFPFCKHCYAHYLALPDKAAGDAYVLCLVEEMGRRVQEASRQGLTFPEWSGPIGKGERERGQGTLRKA